MLARELSETPELIYIQNATDTLLLVGKSGKKYLSCGKLTLARIFRPKRDRASADVPEKLPIQFSPSPPLSW